MKTYQTDEIAAAISISLILFTLLCWAKADRCKLSFTDGGGADTLWLGGGPGGHGGA